MGNAQCWESARKREITEQATVADPDLHLRGEKGAGGGGHLTMNVEFCEDRQIKK